jgi:hypothetical protein
MSKEQTPITAEEHLTKGNFQFVVFDFACILKHYDKEIMLADLMEQYANAKVLEALEKEVIKACMKYNATAIFNKKLAKEYYETEVKPRYERDVFKT